LPKRFAVCAQAGTQSHKIRVKCCPKLGLLHPQGRKRSTVMPEQDHPTYGCQNRLSTRKTLRKADSGATGQHHSRTASVCETVVLQLKVSLRRTNVQRTHSVSFVFFDCPAGRKSGRHSNVAVMQSTDNRNRNQATRSGHGFRCGRGERCSTI